MVGRVVEELILGLGGGNPHEIERKDDQVNSWTFIPSLCNISSLVMCACFPSFFFNLMSTISLLSFSRKYHFISFLLIHYPVLHKASFYLASSIFLPLTHL